MSPGKEIKENPENRRPAMNRGGTLPVYLAAALASLALSAWAAANNHLINHDGVFYLRAIEGDAHAIRWIGHWLFYSRLIGALAAFTGLDPEHAAYLVNALLDLLLVLAFLRLVEALGGNRRTLAWAAVLVLALPYLNGNRAEIIRDHGYWAFTLAALVPYLKLLERFSWRSLAAWNLFMGLATLFRVEGVVFLALMPLGLMLRPVPLARRLGETGKALLPVLAGSAALAGWILLAGGGGDRLSTLATGGGQWLEALTRGIPERAARFRETLFRDLSQGLAVLTVVFSVLLAIAKDLAESLSWPLALMLLFRRWFPAPGLPPRYRQLLLPYAAISLLVLFLQGSRHFVMVSRYTMALALALLPVAAFALEHLWQRYRRGEAPGWLAGLAGLALLGLAGDSLVNRSDHKAYILDAAHWAARHLPPGSRVVTDYETVRLDYYAATAGGKGLSFSRFDPAKSRLTGYDHAFVRHAEGPLAQRIRGKARLLWQSGEGRNGVAVYAIQAGSR